MLYSPLAAVKNAHQLAAKTIRDAGFSARCIENPAGHTPYQVSVNCDAAMAAQLQAQMRAALQNDILIVVAIG